MKQFLKWFLGISLVLSFMTVAVYFLLMNSPKTISKISISGFDHVEEIALALSLRMDQEIKNSQSIKFYIDKNMPERQIFQDKIKALISNKQLIFEDFVPHAFTEIKDEPHQISFFINNLSSDLNCSEELKINCYANDQYRKLLRKKDKFKRKYMGMLDQIGAQRYLLTYIDL